MTDDDNVTSGFQKRKREKIPLACTPCRLRKVKCDGTRPGKEYLVAKGHDLNHLLSGSDSLQSVYKKT